MKALVVYYSAQGTTADVAQTAAAQLGADSFVVEPRQTYSEADLDWTRPDSRVCQEHQAADSPIVELATETVPDWEDYDVVLLGFPIWWGTVAWPLASFVRKQDFGAKKVYPFCTVYSSGMGQAEKVLRELATGGDWQSGQRFGYGFSEADVTAWVERITRENA